MRYAGNQTIYPCDEHDVINIPFADLLDENGKLDLYPEVTGKGYFDIDFRQSQLTLCANRFVGLIPISDRVAIHVRPKAPIANLLYMIWRAGIRLPALTGFVRGYQEHPGTIDDPEEVYVRTFLSALREIQKAGVLKKYQAVQSDVEKRGRLLIAPTVSRFISQGIRHRHVFEYYDLTVDNRENQILKFTAERLLRRFLHNSAGENREVARDLKMLLALFSAVDCSQLTSHAIARDAIRLIRDLPPTHRFYEPALWLSYLIATRSGVVMERTGRARFESVIIDTSEVFEKYVRRLLEESEASHFGGCRVLDGNVRGVPMFVTTKVFVTQPDYYFQRARVNVAVADAKYKRKTDAEERYSLIAFCEALNVKRAAFVLPIFRDEPLTLHVGTTQSGIQVHIVRIDLAAGDLQAEEAAFKQRFAAATGF